MDLRMKGEEISETKYPEWDVKVENGIVPIISGDEEDLQQATLASFIDYGTIPLLPELGVEWTEFFTGNSTFGELDMNIRESLNKAGKTTFYPKYSIDNEKMTMNIGKLGV